jgi:ABC-2 type transport system permease protein
MTVSDGYLPGGFRGFLRQLYFELAKMFGRRRTHIGFGVFVLLEMIFALLFKREKSVEWVHGMMERRASKLGPLRFTVDLDYYYSALTMGHMILAVAVVLLGGLFLALVAGDIVSKEEEDGTLRMVLSRPVSRGRLLAIKYSACGVFTFALIGFAALSSLVTGFLFWKADGGFFVTSKDLDLTAFHKFGPGLWRYILSVPFLALSMFTVTSIAFLFSCLRMKPATATILTLAMLFIDIILKRMEPLQDIKHVFITSRMSSWQLVLERDIDWWTLTQNFLVLALVCAVAFMAGWSVFSRRDFKS